MISMSKLKFFRLEPWMEIIGPFHELKEYEGALLAEIAQCIVVLPLELKEALTPYLGNRIAILRTDIPGKEYLYRVIPEMKESALITAQSLCNDEQMQNYSEVI